MIEKAYWLSEGDNVRVVMPISKVDQVNRTVSGFASVDNIDQQGDIVTIECALDAFSRFRGNLREMHQPIAVGKVLSFSQEPFYDTEAQKAYDGIYVTAYISEGAPDTWTKVLDGTLTGFSIGGNIVDAAPTYDTATKTTIRTVKRMNLFELSLVDNPANQYANILSISKVDGEFVGKGMAVDTQTSNVMYCPDCGVAMSAPSDQNSCDCPQCGNPMQNIGWIEDTGASKVAVGESLKKFVDSYLEKVITTRDFAGVGELGHQHANEFATERNLGHNDNETATIDKGGVSVSNTETVEKAVAVDEVVEETVEKAVETPVDEVVETEAVEKATETEAAEPTLDLTKALEEITVTVTEEVTKSLAAVIEKAVADAVAAATSAATEAATDVVKSLQVDVDKTASDVSEIPEKIDPVFKGISETLDSMAKSIERLEASTAIKKSGDDITRPSGKRTVDWGGHFASVS